MDTTNKGFLYEITRSSKDGKSLSTTVKGFLGFLIPAAILILQGLGITELDQQFFDTLVQTGTDIIQIGSTLISTIMVFYGLVRKMWVAIKNKAGV